jgi:hypothetical protein
MIPNEMAYWWEYREFDRDADVVSSRLASYAEVLRGISGRFDGLSDHLSKITANGRLPKRLEKDMFSTSLSYVSGEHSGVLRYSSSVRYGEGLPDLAGQVAISVDASLLDDEETLDSIFWKSIDFWAAGEAGLYTVRSEWMFRWRWQRKNSLGVLLPNIRLAPHWESGTEIYGGTLYTYPTP